MYKLELLKLLELPAEVNQQFLLSPTNRWTKLLENVLYLQRTAKLKLRKVKLVTIVY